MLPVVRGGLWDAVFGVPFERAIAVHRLMGVVSWAAVTVHMSIWLAKWSAEGINVGANLMATSTLRVSKASTTPTDFSTPIVFFAWLLLSVCSIAAICRRRMPYEVFLGSQVLAKQRPPRSRPHTTVSPIFAFQPTIVANVRLPTHRHYALYFVLLAAELHAWSHWYHTVGALALLALDKVRRIGASAEALSSGAIAIGDVTALHVELQGAGALSYGGQAPRAGCYAFVCVPDIAPNEWHPVTLAAFTSHIDGADEGADAHRSTSLAQHFAKAAGAGSLHCASFYIRSNGLDTWSAKLLALVEARSKASGEAVAGANALYRFADAGAGRGAARPVPTPLLVQVEGFYGSLPLPSDAARVIIVAGGIGITPFNALLVSLMQASAVAAAGCAPRLPRVQLIWVVQEPAMLGLFAATLAMALDEAAAGRLDLDLRLHVTKAYPDLLSPQRSFIIKGPLTELATTMMPNGRRGSIGDNVGAVPPDCMPAKVAAWPAVESGACSFDQAMRVAAIARMGRPLLSDIIKRPGSLTAAEAATGATAVVPAAAAAADSSTLAPAIEEERGQSRLSAVNEVADLDDVPGPSPSAKPLGEELSSPPGGAPAFAGGLGSTGTALFSAASTLPMFVPMQAASATSAPLPAFVRFRGAQVALATTPKAHSDASNTIVMTCGPPSLMESASNAALAAGYLFHSEAFEI